MCVGVRGIQGNGLVQLGEPLAIAGPFVKRLTQVGKGGGVVGIDRERPLVARLRLLQPPLFPQRAPQIAVGLGIAGADIQGAPVAVDRLVGAAQPQQRVAQVVVRLGKAGIEVDGAAKAGLGTLGVVEREEHVAEGIAVGGIPRTDGDCLTDKRERTLMLALLVGDQSAEMEGVGIFRVALENLVVQAGRFVQTARLVAFDGLDQKGLRQRARASAARSGLRFARVHRSPLCNAIPWREQALRSSA